MTLLRAAGFRRMPWKNGGGETFEIAASPPDAAPDAIDWRISMAIVARDGPFSSFPGIDRTLTILDGDGLELALGNAGAPVMLTPDAEPFRFAGDIPAHARLLGGAVTDFNVMTRRSRFGHRVRRLGVRNCATITTTADAAAIFCHGGKLVCTAADEPVATLEYRDCALFRAPPRQLELIAQGQAAVLMAEFYLTTA